jgi:hypothetical protein
MKFHPSMFEAPKASSEIYSPNEKTGDIFITSTVEDLKPPKRFGMTIDDQSLSESNTSALFRGLYGETLLTFLYFSKKNVQSLQNLIKFVVHRETGFVIDTQSNKELLIVMRSIFLEYGAHPKLIDDSMSAQERARLYESYTKEVSRLNEIVVNTVAGKVVSEMLQYLGYLKDASQMPEQMQRPKNDNISGQREYRSITEVLTGHDM